MGIPHLKFIYRIVFHVLLLLDLFVNMIAQFGAVTAPFAFSGGSVEGMDANYSRIRNSNRNCYGVWSCGAAFCRGYSTNYSIGSPTYMLLIPDDGPKNTPSDCNNNLGDIIPRFWHSIGVPFVALIFIFASFALALCCVVAHIIMVCRSAKFSTKKWTLIIFYSLAKICLIASFALFIAYLLNDIQNPNKNISEAPNLPGSGLSLASAFLWLASQIGQLIVEGIADSKKQENSGNGSIQSNTGDTDNGNLNATELVLTESGQLIEAPQNQYSTFTDQPIK